MYAYLLNNLLQQKSIFSSKNIRQLDNFKSLLLNSFKENVR